MSAAMARKRRAESSSVNQSSIPSNIGSNTRPGTAPVGQGPGQGTGLTLPQVISVIDTRLIVLETFMKDTKNTNTETKSAPNPVQSQVQVQTQSQGPEINEIVEEMDTRFDILAREIADLKDVVLKLQAYTMDVNKTLLEERIHILSDLDTTVEDKQTNTLTFENI